MPFTWRNQFNYTVPKIHNFQMSMSPSRLSTRENKYEIEGQVTSFWKRITVFVYSESFRFRMETMERQLAGLSSLVHSALVSKGMSESSQRDMHELRQQILALHPDGAQFSFH